MTTTQIAALIDRHIDAYDRRDPNALSLDHASNGVVVSPMFGRIEGRAQIRDSYVNLFAVFPDWEMRFDAPVVDGNRIAVSFSVSATQLREFMGLPGPGRRCTFEGVSLFQLDAEFLIQQERRIYDFTGLLAQCGVLRLRPA
jgi:predicted ester cyclase